MRDLKQLTVHDLRDLLAECLRGGAGSPKPDVSKQLFHEGLSDSLGAAGPSIEIVRQIHAAGLLTYGDLSMVDVILDNMLPTVAPKHATGWAIAAASTVLTTMLPVPNSLRTSGRTVVNEPEFRSWFDDHRDSLRHDADAGRFRFAAGG